MPYSGIGVDIVSSELPKKSVGLNCNTTPPYFAGNGMAVHRECTINPLQTVGRDYSSDMLYGILDTL